MTEGNPYRQILAGSRVRAPLVGAVIGRLPIAALSLAMVLMIRDATGSFAIAGLVQAAFALAAAIALPAQGRLIDRLGQTRVLAVGAALNPPALVALVIAAAQGASPGALAAIGALGGATIPALGSCMRTLWSDLVPGRGLLPSAYALDAVLTEVAFVVGPLGTAALVTVASPSTAVLANAALSLAGTVIFAFSRASRAWRGRVASAGRAGPLRSPGIVVLLCAELAAGMALGAMELSIVAFATEQGSAPVAGVLIAVQAVASMIGGLWYGARTHVTGAAERYPRLCLLFALGLAPLLLADSIPAAIPAMALSGFVLAPVTAVAFLLIEDLSPAGTATEASTWAITALVVGIAVGNGAAGPLVESGPPQHGFAIAVVAALVGWMVAARGRGALAGVPAAA